VSGGLSLRVIVNWHSTYHILWFTCQETTDIFDNHIHQSRPRLAGGPSHVRRHEAVSRGEQRTIIRGRLYRENVDSGPSEPSVVERFGEIAIDDERSARRIDQERRWLHQRERVAIDYAASFWSQRQIEAHHVRLAKHLVERRPAEVWPIGIRPVHGIVRQHTHA